MKKPSGPKPAKLAPSGFDVGLVDALAKVIARYDLSEIEIGGDGMHVRVARDRGTAAQPAACRGRRRGRAGRGTEGA